MMTASQLSYDAVVVGGGHNGLVSAAYLGRAGLEVLVLEKRHLLGGAAVTEEVWPGFKVSTASYVVSLFPQEIVRDLGLVEHGYHVYPLDPAYFAPFEDGSGLLLWDDPDRAADEIRKIDKRDGDAYVDYCRNLSELAAMIRPLLFQTPPDFGTLSPGNVAKLASLGRFGFSNRKAAARLVDLMTMSCADYLEQYFHDERIKGALAPGGVIGMWGGPMSPGSAYVLLHHRMGEVEGVTGGWGFVRGGMGAISEAIAASARAAGAVIKTEAEVASIDVSGETSTGVTLADGTTIRAPLVLSGIHPRTTFLDLVGEDRLADDFVTEIRRFRTRSPSAKVNLALSGLPDLTAMRGADAGPQHSEIMISPTLEYLEKAWDAVKYGRFSDQPMVDAVIPTTKDQSLAPEGNHVMTCFVQYAPYQPADGPWDDARRAALGDRVVAALERFAPGFSDLVLHRQVLTPFDLEERFGLVGGNIFHGEMAADQLFSFRPAPAASGYRTPIGGLYMCGSGAHPGGGVMGIPGRNASKIVLKDKKKRAPFRSRRPSRP